MRALILLVPLCGILLFYFTASGSDNKNEKFAVYYSNKLQGDDFTGYDLLVLDSRYHPPLKAISEKVPTILGYISLGEIPQTAPYFPIFEKSGLLLKENKDWKGSYSVDIREPLWQQTVIEEIIPGLLRDGFDGIFIDTLDSPLENERMNPEDYYGMTDAGAQLVQAIRLHYPKIKIMVNRSYAILPRISSSIDMILGESVRNTYNFETKLYEPTSEASYNLQVQHLKYAKTLNKDLKVYTLDYADKNDVEKTAYIYRLQRQNGFIPYVTTIDLTNLTKEPESVLVGSVK
ncbi:endo alpha-1,4 polygalactosaminidase [Rickettsiales bacterium]|nr:endo alpha-1,4 polygalactosaminidase [Rickettsiales bacterium]